MIKMTKQKRKTMLIPEPKARYGDTVMVLNYRKRPALWAVGKCHGCEYGSKFSSDDFYWQYFVRVDGYKVSLYVGDAGIEKRDK